MKECPSQVLQQAAFNLSRAYESFFNKKAQKPKFKSKNARNCICFPQHCKLDEAGKRIYIPKAGWIKYKRSRMIEGEVKNVYVSKVNGKYYISVQVELDFEPVEHAKKGTSVALDFGIANWATASNGKFYQPQMLLEKYEKQLRQAQRKLSRQVRKDPITGKSSKNYLKQLDKIGKLHQKIVNCRHDYAHKFSTMICKNHEIVYLEDLSVKNMLSSDKAKFGKKAKRTLNRHTLAQIWRSTRDMMEYKSHRYGCKVFAVPPAYTSQTCPCCGYIDAANRPSQAVFHCVKCGHQEHADIVGAINILNRGRALSEKGVIQPAQLVQAKKKLKRKPKEVCDENNVNNSGVGNAGELRSEFSQTTSLG